MDTRDNTVLDECVHLNILHAINDKLIGIHVAENLIKNHIQILQNVFLNNGWVIQMKMYTFYNCYLYFLHVGRLTDMMWSYNIYYHT